MGTIQIDGSTPKLTIGNATAEDATILFDGNAQDFYIALDDSADDLLIGLGSTVGTTPAISIDENLAVKTYGDITMTGSTPVLTIGDAGAEDTAIVFDGNAQDYHIGLDDSADTLVLGLGSTLGTTPAMTVNSSQVVTFAQNPVFPDGGVAIADLDIDGGTDIGAAIVDADLFIVDDGAGGTNRKTAASRIKTYVGGGITEADTWRITSGFTGNTDPITSNWERDDTAGFGLLGTGMTQSSGVFTFPSTGYWLVGFNSTFYGGATENQYVLSSIHVTTDNSSYAEGSSSYDNVQGSNWQGNASVSKMVDVTSTTNVKVRFASTSQDNNHVANADTAVNYNYVTFIKLADT